MKDVQTKYIVISDHYGDLSKYCLYYGYYLYYSRSVIPNGGHWELNACENDKEVSLV